MTTPLDTCASFVSASLWAQTSTNCNIPLEDYYDGSDQFSTTDSEFEIEEEIVDLSAEMAPAFFESGQLMWEISAHTEGLAREEQPYMSRPEIVLTDSSFLSINVFQDDPLTPEDLERLRSSGKISVDERELAKSSKPLSVHGYFELLTDEDRPLRSYSQSGELTAEPCGKDNTLYLSAKPILNNTALPPSPFHLMDCPTHLAAVDKEWRKQQRLGDEKGQSDMRVPALDLKQLACVQPISPKDAGSLPIADSASDIFSTHDPKFVIGDQNHSRSEASCKPKPAQFRHQWSLPAHIREAGTAPVIAPQCLQHSPEPSPRELPGCSVKELLTTFVASFQAVLKSRSHSKKKKQEKKVLKKLEARMQEVSTPGSSACGVYRRRNTIICQRMEGMINNEDIRTAKSLPKSVSQATMHRTSLSSFSLSSGDVCLGAW